MGTIYQSELYSMGLQICSNVSCRLIHVMRYISLIHSQDVNVEVVIFWIPEMDIEEDRESEESTLTILE